MTVTRPRAIHRLTGCGDAARGASARRTSDIVLLVAGSVVLAVSMAAAAGGSPSDLEVRLFRSANDLSDEIRPLVWPLMQFGTFITIPLLTLVAFAFRRCRLGAAMAVAGVGVYLLAKVVKDWVERGRPGAILDSVEMREVFGEGSLGFPSGHAAVAGALFVVATAYLGRRWIAIGLALVTIVAFGRMYVGAHLPLDLIGGFALGVVVAAAANLVLGVPIRPDRPAS